MKKILIAAGVLSLVGSIPAAGRPNIVLILADDLGAHDLAYTGGDLHQTPNLDKLASRSMSFTGAYAPHSSCSPTRSAILSGKYPARLGIVSHGGLRKVTEGGGIFLMGEEYTLAEALLDNGYTTAHIGKWHIGMDGATGPKDQGFEVDIASNDFCCPGRYFHPFKNTDKGMPPAKAKKAAVPDLGHLKDGDHLTDALGDQAAQFIESRQGKDKPFFLNLWYYAPHTPLAAKREKVEKYRKLIKENKTRNRNPTYAGLVEHLDDSVGKVIDALERTGLADDTIVIFTSDNGGEVRKSVTTNWPLREGKVSLYQGGIRVPLLIRWPGVTKDGTVSDARVSGLDFYPTILEMTGTAGKKEQNEKMDGLNLVPMLKDPSNRVEHESLHYLRYPFVVHYRTGDRTFGPCGTMIKGDWKLMEFFETPHGLEKGFELYNLKADPSESENLAETMPEKVVELRAEMIKWRKELDVPPYKETAYDIYEALKNPLPVGK